MATKKTSRHTVTLMVSGAATTQKRGEFPDREGGETHALLSLFPKSVPKEIDADVLRRNVARCLDKLQGALADIKARAIDGWELESVTVSLSVSAEGSVGVATVGTEAGIEVEFKRPRN